MTFCVSNLEILPMAPLLREYLKSIKPCQGGAQKTQLDNLAKKWRYWPFIIGGRVWPQQEGAEQCHGWHGAVAISRGIKASLTHLGAHNISFHIFYLPRSCLAYMTLKMVPYNFLMPSPGKCIIFSHASASSHFHDIIFVTHSGKRATFGKWLTVVSRNQGRFVQSTVIFIDQY
jgi:hypothetical protein